MEESNTKTICIYHNDADGFCSAWVVHKVFPDAEFVPKNYKEPAPDVTDANVIIVDFSFPRPILLEMAKVAKSIVLIDHHRTSQADLKDISTVAPNIDCTFDMDKCGAELTWEHYFHGQQTPWLVQYVGDRDMWKFLLPDSEAVNSAISTYAFNFGIWDRLANSHPASLVAEGLAVQRYKDRIVQQHVERAWKETIGGVEVPVVNATSLFSEIAGELAKDAPFAACYFDRSKTIRQYSLRSREPSTVDVSAVARSYGGGGHARAAGFEIEH